MYLENVVGDSSEAFAGFGRLQPPPAGQRRSAHNRMPRIAVRTGDKLHRVTHL